MATNAQLLIMIRALQTDVAAIKVRVTNLESAAPVDVSALEARVAKLETMTCPQQSVLDDMEARLSALDGDHVPEP